jgi:tetratricopeptide (TPR) repeat protein
MRRQQGIGAAIVMGLVALAPARAGGQDDLINQARRLDLAGKQDAAIAIYEQALQKTPNSFDAHYGVARALDLAGRYEEAREHFSKAIELSPEETKDQALRMMGVSYAFVGDADAAAEYFQQVFDRRIASANFAGAAEVANELGRVFLELRDPESAFTWYHMAYDTAARQADRPPADVDLAALRWAHAQARIAAREGNGVEARRQEAAVKALLDKGTNPDQQIQYEYLLGYDAFYLKEYARAIQALQKADQEDPFILILLAQASEQTGQSQKAREYYQKAFASTSHAVNNAFARPLARRKLASAPR